LRIGFDARLISSLGIGRYISGLLPHLAEILENRLVVIARPTEIALVRALTDGRCTLITSNAAPYRLAEQTALPITLLRTGLPLVHFPHYNLPILYPRPFVVTVHDLFSFRFPDIHSGVLPRTVNRILIGNAVRRAAAVITPSKATADDIAARFPSAAKRLQPIPEGADARFTPSRNPSSEAAWHRYFGIRPPFLLYLGQWKAYKNVPILIEAFAQVRAQRPEAQLVIAGQDPRHPEIPAAAARLPAGSVVLPGRLPDDAIPDLYRSASAVIMPSLAEGFGLPVLEAMACGVSVVASDIPVLRELADGVAIFCDPSSPASFAEGMIAALNRGPDGDPIQLGLARAETYQWKRAAEATLAIYERALAERPRTRSATD
jgi:glycosyltransferase involved in cell wall biosynthesis